MRMVSFLLAITFTLIHKNLAKYYYKDKDGTYDVYYGPNALWGYKEIKPPKSYKIYFDSRGDRPGKCQNGNFPCQEPYPFKETYVFECEVDYQCPRYFKCCQQRCFQHKICQPVDMPDEDYSDITNSVTTDTPSIFFTTQSSTKSSEFTKPITSTRLTPVFTKKTSKTTKPRTIGTTEFTTKHNLGRTTIKSAATISSSTPLEEKTTTIITRTSDDEDIIFSGDYELVTKDRTTTSDAPSSKLISSPEIEKSTGITGSTSDDDDLIFSGDYELVTKDNNGKFISTTRPSTPVFTKTTMSTEKFPTEAKRTTRLLSTKVPIAIVAKTTTSTAKQQTPTIAKITTVVPFISTTGPTTPVFTKTTISTEKIPTEAKRTTRFLSTKVPIAIVAKTTTSTAKQQTPTTAKTTTVVPFDTKITISTENPLNTRTTTARFVSTTPPVTEKLPDNTRYALTSDQTSKSISSTIKDITKPLISSRSTAGSTEATILTTKPYIQTIPITASITTTKYSIPVSIETTSSSTANPTKYIKNISPTIGNTAIDTISTAKPHTTTLETTITTTKSTILTAKPIATTTSVTKSSTFTAVKQTTIPFYTTKPPSSETMRSVTPIAGTTISSTTHKPYTTTTKPSTVKQLITIVSTSSKRPETKISPTISHTTSDDEDLTFSGDYELITTDITKSQDPTKHVIETTKLQPSSTSSTTEKFTLATTKVPPKSYTLSTPTIITTESEKTRKYNLERTTVKSVAISTSTPLEEKTTRIITSTSDDEDLIFSGDYELVTKDKTTTSDVLSSKLISGSEIMAVSTLAVKSLEGSTESTKSTEVNRPTVSIPDATIKLNTHKDVTTSTHTEDRIDLSTTSKRSIITDDEDLIFSGDGIEQTGTNSDVTTELVNENKIVTMFTILPTEESKLTYNSPEPEITSAKNIQHVTVETSSLQTMTLKPSELEKVAEKQTTSNSLQPIESNKNVIDTPSSTTTFLSTIIPRTVSSKEKDVESGFKYEYSTENTHYDIAETSSLHTIKLNPSTENTTERLSSKSLQPIEINKNDYILSATTIFPSSLIPTPVSDKEKEIIGKTTIITIEESIKSTTGSIKKYTSMPTTNVPESTAMNGKVSSNTVSPDNSGDMTFENKILFVNNLLGQLKKIPSTFDQKSSDSYFPAFIGLAAKIPSVVKIDLADYFNNTNIDGSPYESIAFMDMPSNQSSLEISKTFTDNDLDSSNKIKYDLEKLYFSKNAPYTIPSLKEFPDNEIDEDKFNYGEYQEKTTNLRIPENKELSIKDVNPPILRII